MKKIKSIFMLIGVLYISLSCKKGSKDQNVSNLTFETRVDKFHSELHSILLQEYNRYAFQSKDEKNTERAIQGVFCGKKSGDTITVQWKDKFGGEFELTASNSYFGCSNSNFSKPAENEHDRILQVLATASQILPSMNGGYNKTYELAKIFMNPEVVNIYESQSDKTIPLIGLALAKGNTRNDYLIRNYSYEIEEGGEKYTISLSGRQNPGEWEIRKGSLLTIQGPFTIHSGGEFIGGLSYWDTNDQVYQADLYGDIPFSKQVPEKKIINGEQINGWKTIPITKEEFLEHYKGL